MVVAEETKVTKSDVVSSRGSNDAVPRMLEAARKKHHDVVLVEQNDAFLVVVGQNQNERIWAESLAHFTKVVGLSTTRLNLKPNPKLPAHKPTH